MNFDTCIEMETQKTNLFRTAQNATIAFSQWQRKRAKRQIKFSPRLLELSELSSLNGSLQAMQNFLGQAESFHLKNYEYDCIGKCKMFKRIENMRFHK